MLNPAHLSDMGLPAGTLGSGRVEDVARDPMQSHAATRLLICGFVLDTRLLKSVLFWMDSVRKGKSAHPALGIVFFCRVLSV